MWVEIIKESWVNVLGLKLGHEDRSDLNGEEKRGHIRR